MNPILQLLMGTTMSKGIGDRFGGNQTSDLKNLTDAYAQSLGPNSAYASFRQAAGPESTDKPPAQSPMDRIKAAFDSLKDMHKGPDQTAANTGVLPQNGASPFDNAQWPYGPVGAPSQAQASVPQQTPSQGVPMPMARPADAPQANPMMSLFQRSAAMQQDPLTGSYIDPASAAKAQPNIFQGLF
jgi:hypothetical protein